MKTQDFPESEEIEDRRRDEPADAPGPWTKLGSALSDTARAIYNSPKEEEHHGDLSDEAGYNDAPPIQSRGDQVVGVAKQIGESVSDAYNKGPDSGPPPDEEDEGGGLAKGGPVSSLKRINKHPIFPNVRIVHARIRGLVASSPDLKTITINAAVPTTINVNGKRVPTAAPLAVRELYTRAGCEVFREAAQKHGHAANERDIRSCGDAHAGQVAEKQFLREHYKFNDNDLAVFTQIMRRLVGSSAPS